MKQSEKIRSDAVEAVHEAAAIANWNDEGGAPPAPQQKHKQQQQAQRERPERIRLADHEQVDT